MALYEIKPVLSIYVLLLCTMQVVAFSLESTTWNVDCGIGVEDTVPCTLEIAECYPEPGTPGTVNNITTTSRMDLSITPVCTEVFTDTLGGGESRWYPKVNISWPNVETSGQEHIYFIVMTYQNKDYVSYHQTSCKKCFSLTTRNLSPASTTPAHTRVALLSGNMFHCNSGLHPLFLHVRVSELRRTVRDVRDISISFPADRDNSIGLPTCYRRIVPRTEANICSFNPCTWTTTLVVTNSSCNKEIRVQFELAPEDIMDTYVLRLTEYHQDKPITSNFSPKASDVIGMVEFKDLNPGIYSILLTFSVKHHPLIQSSKYDCAIPVSSGFLTITGSINCTTLAVSSPEAVDSAVKYSDIIMPFLAVIFILIIMSIVVLLVTLITINRNKDHNECQNQPFIEQPVGLSNIVPQRKRVLLVYCIESDFHQDLVQRFAELLQIEGLCDVILDKFHINDISKLGVHGWVNAVYASADKVIVIGSEAVSKFLDAKRQNCYYPRLEMAFPLSNVFPSAVRVLNDATSNSSHATSKALAVTFDYTAPKQSCADALRDLTGNDVCYNLTKDMERVLLAIHDTNKYQCGNSIMEWDINLMQTESGKKFQVELENARKFYECEEHSFVNTYGSPKPYPVSTIKADDPFFSDVKFFDDKAVDLIPPEDYQLEVDIHERLLVPPIDEMVSPYQSIQGLHASDEEAEKEEEKEEEEKEEQEQEDLEQEEQEKEYIHSESSCGEHFDSGIVMSVLTQERRSSTNVIFSEGNGWRGYECTSNSNSELDEEQGLLSHHKYTPPSDSLSPPSSLSDSVSMSEFDIEEGLI